MRVRPSALILFWGAFLSTGVAAFADYPIMTYPLDTASTGGGPPLTSVQVAIRIGPNFSNTNYCMPPYVNWCVPVIDRTITAADVGKSFTIDSSSPNFLAIAEALSSSYGFALSTALLNGAGGRFSDVPLRGEVTSLVLTIDHFCSSPPLGCVFTNGTYYDNVIQMHLMVLGLQIVSAIPQVGAGDTWSTGFLVVNTGTTDAQFNVSFFDDSGHQIGLPFDTGPMKTVTAIIPALGSLYVEAGDPSATLLTGWGKVTADPTLVVQSVLRNRADGTHYAAAVPTSVGHYGFLVAFDATIFAGTKAPYYTGFAIVNMDETVPAFVACTARDSLGNVIPNAIPMPSQLPPLGHWSNYLFPLLTGKRGTIDCQSNTKVAATAFRFIGTSAFSSLPVIEH